MTPQDDLPYVEQEVFWATRGGFRWSWRRTRDEANAYIASEAEALGSEGWTVEVTVESLPLVRGELVCGEGEAISLDDDGVEVDRQPCSPVHVFWRCPHCGLDHNVGLYADPVQRLNPYVSPALWTCERESLLALVSW